MMRFHVVIDAYMEAEGVDDCFSKLSDHFLALAVDDDEESSPFLSPSHLAIDPVS